MSSSAIPHHPVFIGRQPILDRRLHTVGYELLFRMAPWNHTVHSESDGTSYTAQVILNAFVEIGLDNVVGDKLAFVNATRAFLLEAPALELPASRVVIEVLEDVTPDDEVLAAVARLRDGGYQIALDDFVYHPTLAPLVALANVIKIDLSRLSEAGVEEHVARLRRPGARLLAERVETIEQFAFCKRLGFDYFQGFFLARPTVLRGERRTSNHVAALRLLALLEDPMTPIAEIERAISLDPTLGYRLLKVINSAAFSLRRRIDSLRQALVLLGLKRVQGWVTLMVLAGLSSKPPVLLETALMRARMCEQIGARLEPERAASYFTVGLFSALDVMLDTPLPILVDDLPLSPDVVDALLDGTGTMGRVLAAVIAYERCEWERVAVPNVHPSEVGQAYYDTLAWVRRTVEQGAIAA